MKKSTILVAVIVMLSAEQLYAKSFNSPESVVFDKNSNRYLISNAGGGNILARSMSGTLGYFATGLSSPKGMCVYNNVVYVTDNKYVKGYLLSNGGLVMNLYISTAVGLNDIAWANGYLYAGDMSGNKIYKINTVNKSWSVWASTGLTSPNGLLYDKYNNRLIAVSYTSNAKIYGISLSTGNVSVLASTSYGNFDGITKDDSGYIYISSWTNSSIFRYDSTLTGSASVYASGVSSPADIFYNKEEKVLAVPLFNMNILAFYDFLSAPMFTSGSTSICPGSSVKLSTVTGSALSYQWKRNGYNHSTSAFILANMAGSYTVTVTNNLGSVTSAPVQVSVLPQPAKPTITYTGPTSFCHGDSLVLHAPSGFASYKWSDLNGGIQDIIKSTGSYHLVVYDTNNCARDRKSTRLNSSHTDISRMPSSA